MYTRTCVYLRAFWFLRPVECAFVFEHESTVCWAGTATPTSQAPTPHHTTPHDIVHSTARLFNHCSNNRGSVHSLQWHIYLSWYNYNRHKQAYVDMLRYIHIKQEGMRVIRV